MLQHGLVPLNDAAGAKASTDDDAAINIGTQTRRNFMVVVYYQILSKILPVQELLNEIKRLYV